MDAGIHAHLLELVLEGLRPLPVAAVAGGDGRALIGEAAADGSTDPARAAGDQRDSALELLTVRGPGLVAGLGPWFLARFSRGHLSFLLFDFAAGRQPPGDLRPDLLACLGAG